MPPDNQSPDVQGTYIFLSTITKPLADRGYYVYPVAVVDEYFKANGVSVAQEMNRIPREKLNEQFAPDAILYTRIDYLGQKFSALGVESYGLVDGEMTLIGARSGQVLWQKRFYWNDSSNTGTGGWLANLIGAVIVQAVTTEKKFFRATQIANESAYRGFWEGALVTAE